MSSAPPWVKYQKKAESGPWEKYQTPREQPEFGIEVGKSVLGNRPEQTGLQNWLEVAGEMYTGDSESLPMQAKGAMTAAGMTLPGIALPAMAGSAGIVGAAARLMSDPRVTAPVAAGMELYRSGSPTKAIGAALMGGGGGFAIGRMLTKRALTLKQAEEAMRTATAKKAEAERVLAEAEKMKRIASEAAALRTSTPVSAAGPATSTRTTPGDLIPFPTNPQQAAVAMRVPARAPQPMPANPTEAAAALSAPKAARVPTAPKVQPESSTLEQQLRETVKLSKGARKQLSQAQELEARIVEWTTRQGQSEAQIVKSLKDIFGIREPGAAKEMVDLVLKTHGLK